MPEDLQQLANLDTESLLQKIVENYDVEPQLYSPDGFRARGREVLGDLMTTAKAHICDNEALVGLPEAELAAQIYAALEGTVMAHVLAPFAVYVAKVGVQLMCRDY